jgi:hypothetical protein
MVIAPPPFRDPIVDKKTGQMTPSWQLWISNLQILLAQTPSIFTSSGTPENVVTGNLGDLCVSRLGGAATTFYVKEAGAGTNTGWDAK